MIFDGNAELHIKGLEIDWDKIDRNSYLREIPSMGNFHHYDMFGSYLAASITTAVIMLISVVLIKLYFLKKN